MESKPPIGQYKFLMSRDMTAKRDYFAIREYSKENFASGVWHLVEQQKKNECQILIFTLGDYMWINVRKVDLIPVP